MAPKAHAVLGASSAHRWMNCPGSVRLSEGRPDRQTEYSREGTAAHTVLERALRKRLPADTWLDTVVQVPEHNDDGSLKEMHDIIVTEEMCESVQVCIDQVLRLIDHPTTQLFIEQKFDLSPLNPPGPMYGTADAVIWIPHRKHLAIVDYKHGAGVAVDATENEQEMYYAIGALLEIDVVPETISCTIVQPRAHHPDGIIRSYTLPFSELKTFKKILFDAARRTQDPDAPLVPGDHCRFCKAFPVCPEQRRLAVEVVQSEFDAEDAPVVLPSPELLTDEQISKILTVRPQLVEWFREIEQYIENKLSRGEDVPGWKLVAKRATRKWKDEDTAREYLKEALDEDAFVTKLVSPAQAEKALKKHKIKAEIEDLVVKQSSGFNVVPDHDKRPALLAAVHEFDAEDAQP